MKEADRVRAAADAGDQAVGQATLGLQHLRPRLLADHALEVAHHGRIGMRAGDGADAIIGVAHVGHPVAQGLVHRVLERARALLDGPHLRAQHLHAEHVGLLPLDVDRAHVDDAFEAESRASRRGRDAVLSGAGFGDDALFSHAAGKQDLADHVVDLVRAGVVELLALEIDLGAAEFFGQPLGEIERARAPDIMLEQMIELGLERGIGLCLLIGLLELKDQRHQRFGHEPSAVNAEASALVGSSAIGIGLLELAHAQLTPAASQREGPPRRGDERPDPGLVLDAGRALDAGGDIDAARAAQLDRLRHVAGVEPPGEKPWDARTKVPRNAPVERAAVAARQRRVLGRLGVDQEIVRDALVSIGLSEIVARGDPDRLHRRAARKARRSASPAPAFRSHAIA